MNNKKLARITGLIYLLVVITGVLSLAYIPSQLIDWKNGNITLSNLIKHESLFRIGIALHVICYLAFTALGLAFYRLLHSVNQGFARVMLILVLLSIPISFINLQHKYEVLNILKVAKVKLDANHATQALQNLHSYNDGILIVSVFWGLWLFPLGYLLYHSHQFPKVLSILLMLGCLTYLINFFGNTLIEDYKSLGFPSYLSMVSGIAEIGTCIWLIIFGFKQKQD
ncbi:MAG: DUF4386 domain-containing protein [Flammeovirgaceae bacterium]|jgi:hypothetical protein|nr:DUF4386 domain-containing protein [Flammeovirgaceae bacterium]